ncbi:MAG: class I SAM-dependent methyltransferase [Chloroflexi bacterium]|nr:class I SAM-dependent methyltransferase [Chloroflexota bacterium]
MRNESRNNLASSHYDQSYFSWQSDIGEFGGWANAPLFSRFIRPSDAVLDFGCGGGWLLKNISCQRRLGVEVNPVAADAARKNGVEIFGAARDVPDLAADVVISNHALEHVLHPLHELISLRPKLQPGGLAVFIVPCENIRGKYFPNDINHHLYTWNPMNLGNLFTEAGYLVVESRPLMHKWPVKFRLLARAAGRRVFDFASWVYAHLNRSSFQVRIIACAQ